MSLRLARGVGALACYAAFSSSCRIGYEPLPLASSGGSHASGGAQPNGGGAAGGDTSAGGATSKAGRDTMNAGGDTMNTGGDTMNAGAPTAGSAGAPEPPRCTAPVSPITDYCTSVPRLTEAVALDGKLDCGLTPIDVEPLGWAYDPGQLDATLRFAAAWDDGGIYFFLDVRDPSPVLADAADPMWMGDSVELYVDTNASYENPPGYDAVGTRQLCIGRTHSDGTGLRGQINADSVTGFPVDWTPERVLVTSTDQGYVVEAYVPGNVLDVPTWMLSAGDRVGLDVGVNVSFADPQSTGTQGHRLGQFFYQQSSPPAGEPYRNVAGFCTPLLME